MTKADNDFNYIKPENFHGKTIGAQSPAPQAEEAEATFGKHNATVKFYPSQNDTNMGLTNGRLDGIIADKFYLATWMTSGEGKDYAAMDAIVANGIYFVMW